MLYYGVSIVEFEQVNADWEEMTRLCPNYWQIHISSHFFSDIHYVAKNFEIDGMREMKTQKYFGITFSLSKGKLFNPDSRLWHLITFKRR